MHLLTLKPRPVAAIVYTVLSLVCSAGMRAQTFEEYTHTVGQLYAGKYEARIGGSVEPAADKLRLDIGASIDVLTIRDSSGVVGSIARERNRLSVGIDFFTWSRLRSDPGFKFPVETIDYFLGFNSGLRLARIAGHQPLISEIRIRFGHISAHLVDGDPSFHTASGLDSSELKPMVYSREFIDGMVAADGERMARALGISHSSLRPYIGFLWVFHDIPSIAERATFYGGFDGFFTPFPALPFTIKAGYEARLNTEVSPSIGEHHARLGLKIGKQHSNGFVIETGYYSGRSMYGQNFGRRESYASLGFSIDY